MAPWRRVILTIFTLWILVATNPGSPGSRSFQKFMTDLDKSEEIASDICHDDLNRRTCVDSRRAYPELNRILESLFAPHRNPFSPLHVNPNQHFESVDYALFTLIRAKPSSTSDPPPHGFLGILGTWLPYPHPARLTGSAELGHAFRLLRIAVRQTRLFIFQSSPNALESFRRRTLPDRPWEWLIALFTVVGAIWLMFPQRAREHLTLTWQNVRHKGHWWCLVLFHFSHGGSWLRLCRTIVVVNYLAPILVARHVVNLSSLYGVVLTSSATSTALGMLVLARRYVFAPRDAWPRAPLEINGGGACVYALLVAACLSPASCDPFPFLGGARPFELLMLNVLFDSFFLAGQKQIADYTAHTGAALGSWLFYSVNMTS